MPDSKKPGDYTPDALAAQDFLTELRTRIALQPLPYQSGIEASALESLWKIFDHARNAIKKYPGCEHFAHVVTDLLNIHVRPVTAKWHRAHAEGRLASRDGADEFRGDLEKVRLKLWDYARILHLMAYDSPLEDKESPAVMSDDDVDKCMKPLAFGITGDERLIPRHMAGFINRSEAEAVEARRTHHGIQTQRGMDAIGLGLSGGGIRSATFCLGAIQVLAQRNLLKNVDFLSTVSGGGYTGSFLTSRLGNGESHDAVAGPKGPDPDAVRRLRQYAKYMAASDLSQRWQMVVGTLAGMLLNWTAPLLVIVLAALVAHGLPRPTPDQWKMAMAICGGLAALALALYAALMREKGAAAIRGNRALAISVALVVIIVVLWLLDRAREITLPHWQTVGVIGSLTAAAPAVMRFVPILRKPLVRRIALQVLLIVAGIVIPLGAIGLFCVFLELDWRILAGLAVGFGLLSVFVLNINLTSPHRLYRDQLAQTFIHLHDGDSAPKKLSEINPKDSAPYHLINTTVNLPASTHIALRDRRADFFLFSKHWCGSPATQYRETTAWRTNDEPVDLATAMAISGAAFSSHMGLASKPTLTALLTFLNVRLGFWIRNAPLMTRAADVPGASCLLREMTGIDMAENRFWLNLSDGGHIENMAVYELLRRRCKFIISIDGEADPQSTFPGHLTLVRHAQIDLGVRIDSVLEDLRPNPASKHSKTHFMFCRITYPPRPGETENGCGLLLYVKLSATGNEAELIKRYRQNNPDFPHQTTLDQFFDEEQFEAYRQLGAHALDGLFSDALMKDPRTDEQPKTIPQWFRRLARNLLEPVQAG